MKKIQEIPQFVVATRNEHKLREIRQIFYALPVECVSLSTFPDAPKIHEDGQTFEENAIKKALGIAQYTGKPCLADDSGIEVDHLKGEPGIYSARYAGENATDEENNRKLLQLLKDVPLATRNARYRCVMALAMPDGKIRTTEGTCDGLITVEPSGNNGFGYDPIFYYPPFGKTFGLTDSVSKNRVSHRYQALQKMKPIILELLHALG